MGVEDKRDGKMDNVELAVKKALLSMALSHGVEGEIEVPPPSPVPDMKMGDRGFAMFSLAKVFHASPVAIAEEAAKLLNDEENRKKDYSNNGKMPHGGESIECLGEFLAVGPYLNVRLNRKSIVQKVLNTVRKEGKDYGRGKGKSRVMVEFSCPNTNKPLHLGHLRNDALGESLSRILSFIGDTVCKVDLINDRGVHICKSMLAYKMYHEERGDTPEGLGLKGDHFVGKCYVEYAKAEKENIALQKSAEDMLVKWEGGDGETRALWEKMNKWTIDGIEETYRRTGISFDKVYRESNTYLLGKDEVIRGEKAGVFFRADDGSIRCDITEAVGQSREGGAQEKVLLRKDGTSVYITQDIGTAIMRHNEWQYDKMIYVVAAEQSYHFKTLFYILGKLGYDWAKRLYHLSYGLVNLPEGRMKSREGTVVDADDLLDSLHSDALEAIKERGREGDVNAEEVAEKVALGALHYYLLQAAPNKDMLFDPKKSLSFTGDTGPYLQYMCARIESILKKAKDEGIEEGDKLSAEYLTSDTSWAVVQAIKEWPSIVRKASEECDPSIVALYLKGLAKAFSKFYEESPILQAESGVKEERLILAKCTLTVMRSAMRLILVPYLEKM